MINSIGTIQLTTGALAAYSSPKITVIGQSSHRNTGDAVYLNIEIGNQDLTEASTTTLQMPIREIEGMMTANSVDGATFVTNLYPMMEQLLMLHLMEINPNSTFELV